MLDFRTEQLRIQTFDVASRLAFYKKEAARGGPGNGRIYAVRLSVFSDHFEHVGSAAMQDGAHGIQAKTDNGFGFDERWAHEL